MSTKAYTLLLSLVPRLQAISIANGYATDAGTSVLLGPVPRQTGEAFPFCRVHETGADNESEVAHRPHATIRVNFVAEAFASEPAAADVLATGHLLVGDLKKALFGDAQRDLNGQAIAARLEGYSIVPPEDGSDVVIAQVRGSFSFVDHFNSP